MLLHLSSKDYYNCIINLDNMVRMSANENKIEMLGSDGSYVTIIKCESEEEANKILKKIYFNMTYSNGNMIFDLEEFRKEEKETETAKTRKALRNNKCNTCIYVDTDGCKEWDNDGTGCDAHITEEEAMKDVNEEK